MANEKKIEIHYTTGDWAALYVDGKLETQGHEDSVHENVLSLLGVEQVYDAAFMRGDLSGKKTAKTTAEIAEYVRERDEARTRARDLRAQAEELLAAAAKLENK